MAGDTKDIDQAVLDAVFGDDADDEAQSATSTDDIRTTLDAAIKALDDGELYRGRQILIDLRLRLAKG